MKRIFLALPMLLIFASFSKNEIAVNKFVNNVVQVSGNKGLYLTVKDEEGCVINKECVALHYNIGKAQLTNNGYVNPDILERYCNPFELVEGRGFVFLENPDEWGLPSDNYNFFGKEEDKESLSSFLDSDYEFLNNIVPPGLQMKYSLKGGYTYTLNEKGEKDANGNYTFKNLKNTMSPLEVTYVRDFLTCRILDTYTTDIESNPNHVYYGFYLSVGDISTEEYIGANGIPFRTINVKFLFGTWVPGLD